MLMKKSDQFPRSETEKRILNKMQKEKSISELRFSSELRFIKYILHIFYSAQGVWTMTQENNEMSPLR